MQHQNVAIGGDASLIAEDYLTGIGVSLDTNEVGVYCFSIGRIEYFLKN